MKIVYFLLLAFVAGITASRAADSKIAADAVNALGMDLYRAHTAGEGNVLLSPYSIQNALAMTYAGAAGATHSEMQRVLHYPADDDTLHASFDTLAAELEGVAAKSLEAVKAANDFGGPKTPIEFNLANRLFAQRGYDFRASFLDLVKKCYGAPLAEVDYRNGSEKVRAEINQWVAEQTKDRLRDLLPPGAITPDSRLTLVNALYLRAPWHVPFKERSTKPESFLVNGRDPAEIPTMQARSACGYARRDGFQIITRAYDGGELQFVILLPNQPDGLAGLERKLTPALLAECAHIPVIQLILHLPKFRLEPATLALRENLMALGLKTAFDDPRDSADFDGMAPRQPSGGLSIGNVFHRAWLAVDEKGTEAAAATAVKVFISDRVPEAIAEARVDHPFIFAIQHVPSGACLFLGRVTDPR